LNRSYFGELQLRTMASNLARYLKSGAVLAVCRTDDDTGIHHGTIFRKDWEGQELKEVAQSGNSSEIRDIVLSNSIGGPRADVQVHNGSSIE
jgi:hypothetical protein